MTAHASAIRGACLSLMEATVATSLAADRLFAVEKLHTRSSRATIEVVQMWGCGASFGPSVWLGPTSRTPTLNKFSLGAFHRIEPSVRTMSALPAMLGRPIDQNLSADLERKATLCENALDALHSVMTDAGFDRSVSFEVSARDGIVALDLATWDAAPIAANSDPKTGFVAAANAIDALIDVASKASADPQAAATPWKENFFKRPVRRSWPKALSDNPRVSYYASNPFITAPNEAVALALIETVYEGLAQTGHAIPPRTGKDRLVATDL